MTSRSVALSPFIALFVIQHFGKNTHTQAHTRCLPFHFLLPDNTGNSSFRLVSNYLCSSHSNSQFTNKVRRKLNYLKQRLRRLVDRTAVLAFLKIKTTLPATSFCKEDDVFLIYFTEEDNYVGSDFSISFL